MKTFVVSILLLTPLAVAAETVSKNGVPFDQVADHCYGIADTKSREWEMQYDLDSMAADMALQMERRKLRKQIYLKCMEYNGFSNVKFEKRRVASQ